jgi:Tol biopolymer transport system component
MSVPFARSAVFLLALTLFGCEQSGGPTQPEREPEPTPDTGAPEPEPPPPPSPTGQWLAVAGLGSHRAPQTWLVDPATGDAVPFSERYLWPLHDGDGNRGFYDCVWSADGTRVAYQQRDGIYVADLERQEILLATGGDDVYPSWAPDGQRLVFARRHGNEDYDLYTADVTSGHTELLFDDEDTSYMPAWSPQDSLIAFIRVLPGSPRGNIWLIDPADPTRLRRLTGQLRGSRMLQPSWFPDGSHLTFVLWTEYNPPSSQPDVPPPAVGPRLWRIDADGSNPELVHRSGGSHAWSQDGSALVVSTGGCCDPSVRRTWLLEPETEAMWEVKLDAIAEYFSQPTWTPFPGPLDTTGAVQADEAHLNWVP